MLLAVLFGWVLFAIDDANTLFAYFGTMFGSNGFAGGESVYLLLKYLGLLIVCVVASMPVFKLLNKLPKVLRVVVTNLFLVAVLVASIALIVGDSYNPFLYFRF